MKQLFYALWLSLVSLPAAWAQQVPAPTPALLTDARSLEFIPNQGQWPAAVRYAGAVPGGHLYLEATGLHYVLLQPIPHPHLEKGNHAAPRLPATDSLIRGHQLRVHFVGADAGTPLLPEQATGGVRNYLHGNDPKAWARNVPGYRQVRYQNPWPGIGARFYENAGHQLEYDFEVAAGADPALVQLRYDGASALALGTDGRLHVGTTVGELTELAPRAYQTNPHTGQHQRVACRYQLNPEDSTVSFALGRYDHGRPLVIDPTVQFSTYSGATGDNWGFTAAYDAAGNIYSGGIVLDYGPGFTADYPTTTGAFQTTFGGLIDMAFIKYNPTASGPAARVWATYVGGSFQDIPTSLIVNSNNELIILGTTASADYPVSATAYQHAWAGGTPANPFSFGGDSTSIYVFSRGTDIVVTRLTADGSALAASTYLGGSDNDGLVALNKLTTARQLPQNYGDPFRGDVSVDAQGNIYVASVTASTNFPVTPGSFGTTYKGGTCDAVVMKLPASLSSLTWSGYLGGSAADAAYSLQLDATGNVYVCGGTLSPNFPTTAGAVSTAAPGDVDGFVARIAANGSSIQKATYLGTSTYDQAYFVQLGADGGVYLLGQTLGAWPVSAGVYSNAGSRQFIQKLSADLDQRLLSTVFGSGRSTLDISPTAFLVDQCDRVYVCGWGGNVNQVVSPSLASLNGYTHGMPTTPNAVRTTPDTPGFGSDFYLAQFAPGLTALTYGTFYGNPDPNSEGDHVDGGTSRFDPRGIVYAAVCSCGNSNSFPVPPGANTYSATNNSFNCNNAAFKLNFEPTTAQVGPGQVVCTTGNAIRLTSGSPAGGVWSGPGVSGSVATGFVFTPTPALAGNQTLTYTVLGATAVCNASAQLVIRVVAATQASASTLPAVCAIGQALPLTGGSPTGGTWMGPGVSGSVATGFVFTAAPALVGTQTLTYTVSGTAACGFYTSQTTATVQVLPVFTATVPTDTTLCPGSGAVRLRGTPAGGVWSGPGVAGNTFTPPTTAGTVVLTYTVGGSSPCAASATRRFTLLAAPVLAPALVPAACAPSQVAPYTVHYTQSAASLPTGAVLTWHFGDSSPDATGFDVTHTYAQAGTYQPSVTVSFTQASCSQSMAVAPVVVKAMFIPNIITPNNDQKNDFFVPLLGGCPPHLQVFSRWGRRVYDDPAYRNTWGGENLEAGTYYYLLTPPDGSPALKGWVQVVR